MKLKSLKLAPFLIAACVIAAVCAVRMLRLDFFERLERITYDARVREAYTHSPVVARNLGFVVISDDTITRIQNGSVSTNFHYGLYWPRHIYGRVTRELYTEGAKVVAYDVLFAGMRTDHNPVALKDGNGLAVVESDEYFANILRLSGNVLLASEKRTLPAPIFRTNALAIGDITAERDADGVLRRARAFQTYKKWHRFFQRMEANPDNGIDLDKARLEPGKLILPIPSANTNLVFPLNAEGKFDVYGSDENTPPGRQRFQRPYTEERIWQMGIMLAAQELKLDLANAEVDFTHGRIILRGPNVERVIPVDADGYFYVDWSLPIDAPQLAKEPFEELLKYDTLRLEGKTNDLPHDWQGKLVVVGSMATGNDLTDQGATPLEKAGFMVSKHWNVANSIITGRFIRVASLPMELLLILLTGIISAVLTTRLGSIWGTVAVVLASLAYIAGAYAVFDLHRYWLPMVMPVGGGFLMNYVCLLLYLIFFEKKEQRRVRSVFAKMVSPDIAQELLKSEKLKLGGARRNVTVLFSDVRGFTEMTDLNREKAELFVKQHSLTGPDAEAVREQDARETLSTVNDYLSLIAEKVIENKGTIDKFIGDCVMAFWGAPGEDPLHALHCVNAALDIQRAIYRLNRQRQEENLRREEENIKRTVEGQPLLPLLPILAVGTGINTGDVTAGLMGNEQHGRLNYTVFGREVNLASRLESVSGRSRIIISEATLSRIYVDAPDLAVNCVELPPEKVKGFKEPVHIFEVPWRTGEYASTGETVAPFKVPGEDTKVLGKPRA